MAKKIISLVILILLPVVFFIFNRTWETAAAKTEVNFTITDINGQIFCSQDLKGKVVLIDFWATWCGFCRLSIPILNSLYSRYGEKGLEIISISSESEASLRLFAKQNSIIYPVAEDKNNLAADFGVYGIPTRFFINQQGQIVQRSIGFQDKESLQSAVKQLLK